MTSESKSSAQKTKERIQELLSPKLTEKEHAHCQNELRILFSKLQSTNELQFSTKHLTAVQQKWNAWLKKKHGEFMTLLLEDVGEGKKYALRTFFGVVAATASLDLYEKFMFQFVKAICRNDIEDSFLKMLQIEFFVYRDVQYYTLTSVRKLADGSKDVGDACVRLLMLIDVVKSKEELEDGRFLVDMDDENDSEESDKAAPRSYKRHRAALANAYLSTLRLPLTTHKTILTVLPSLIPCMAHPIRLSDYLTQSYSLGGLSSVLSLEGLFLLMTQHNLEYPQFYNSLYALINTSIFYSAHRLKFLQLLSFVLLKSQMLPAYLIAAFCKRLARIALTSPPSGILFILALISNLLRKHNACQCLLNRNAQDQSDDPFNPETNDTVQTQALQSSLWELNALENHYHPDVVTLAKSIGFEDDKMPSYDIDMFLDLSYDSLKEGSERKRKGAPLTFSRPEKLICRDEVWNEVFDGIP